MRFVKEHSITLVVWIFIFLFSEEAGIGNMGVELSGQLYPCCKVGENWTCSRQESYEQIRFGTQSGAESAKLVGNQEDCNSASWQLENQG